MCIYYCIAYVEGAYICTVLHGILLQPYLVRTVQASNGEN
jgi:hypothetical protein